MDVAKETKLRAEIKGLLHLHNDENTNTNILAMLGLDSQYFGASVWIAWDPNEVIVTRDNRLKDDEPFDLDEEHPLLIDLERGGLGKPTVAVYQWPRDLGPMHGQLTFTFPELQIKEEWAKFVKSWHAITKQMDPALPSFASPKPAITKVQDIRFDDVDIDAQDDNYVEEEIIPEIVESPEPKRGRGRPKGSHNRKDCDSEIVGLLRDIHSMLFEIKSKL